MCTMSSQDGSPIRRLYRSRRDQLDSRNCLGYGELRQYRPYGGQSPLADHVAARRSAGPNDLARVLTKEEEK